MINPTLHTTVDGHSEDQNREGRNPAVRGPAALRHEVRVPPDEVRPSSGLAPVPPASAPGILQGGLGGLVSAKPSTQRR